jgi:hypothetical protein
LLFALGVCLLFAGVGQSEYGIYFAMCGFERVGGISGLGFDEIGVGG